VLAVGENGILEGCRRLPDEEKACLLMPECARRYRYLDGLTTMFVVILLVSNLVAQKNCMIGPFAVSGAVLLFPITYIFGDVFTEVYGFSASRRATWLGTLGTVLLSLMGVLVIALPGAPGWKNQGRSGWCSGFCRGSRPLRRSRSGRGILPTRTPWRG
jgi:hypothetical protein